MKLFRIYGIIAIFLLSATVTASCFFIADEAAKEISLGEGHAVIAMNGLDEISAASGDISRLAEAVKEAIKRAAGF